MSHVPRRFTFWTSRPYWSVGIPAGNCVSYHLHQFPSHLPAGMPTLPDRVRIAGCAGCELRPGRASAKMLPDMSTLNDLKLAQKSAVLQQQLVTELNALVEDWDVADDARRIGARPRTVGQMFAIEAPLLRPLPAEPFDTALTLAPRVDRYAQVMMRCNQYSVPAQGMPGPARSPDARRVRQFGGRRSIRFLTAPHPPVAILL